MRRRIEAVMAAKIPKTKIDGKGTPWRFIGSRETEHNFEFAFSVPVGMSCEDLVKHQPALVASLGRPVEIVDRGGVVMIKVVKTDFKDLIEFDQNMLIETDDLLLGYSREGDAIHMSNINPHLLLAGASGYGKTDAIRFYMLQMLNQYNDIDISIIDLKGFSFLPFEQIGVNVVDDITEAKDVLKDAYNTMRQRIKMIRDSGNRNRCNALPWKIVIIDEYAELSPNIITDPEEKKIARECTKYISSLIRIGREIRCAVWLCTQYPTKEVIHNQIKAQMINIVSFKLEDEIESQTVLGNNLAYRLPPIPGRGIVKGKGMIQVPYVGNDSDWEKVLSPYKREVGQHDHTTETTNQTREVEAEYTDVFEYDENYGYPTSGEVLQWSFPTKASIRDIKGVRKRKDH